MITLPQITYRSKYEKEVKGKGVEGLLQSPYFEQMKKATSLASNVSASLKLINYVLCSRTNTDTLYLTGELFQRSRRISEYVYLRYGDTELCAG